MARQKCTIDGCTRNRVGWGLCDRHYWRTVRNGEPGVPGRVKVHDGASLEERFRHAGHRVTESGCHEWTRAKNSRGYGNLSDGKRTRSAHRVAWELANGRPVPHGLEIRHTCDNRACVNPDHLIIGTHKQNMEDRSIRGRYRGEQSPTAKLTEDDVREIRSRLVGVTVAELARTYGVAQRTMWAVVSGRSWKHVTVDLDVAN